jgi:biotin carboxyl carrier protein
MGIDAGPWTIEPDDAAEAGIHWRGDKEAVLVDESAAADPTPIILGATERRPGAGSSGAERREIVVGGWRILLEVEPERTARLRERARRGGTDAALSGPLEVRAIIPGRVVAVAVADGDTVEAGQQLLVIEAMKMQNELRSPRAGTVERVAVGIGQTVELGALLVVLR